MTPSDNYLTISSHNLELLHSAILHSYPVPLHEFAVVYKDKPLKRYNLMSQPQVIMAKKLWILSNLSMQGVGTEYSLNSRIACLINSSQDPNCIHYKIIFFYVIYL